MSLVVIPVGIGGLGDVEVRCFTKGVLAGVCATDFYVQGIRSVAAEDDDGLLSESTQGLKDGLTELLKGRNEQRWYGVVDVVDNCCSASFEFSYCEVRGQS